MRGCMVQCWHPDSPGTKVIVWRSWWQRKRKPFASNHEVKLWHRYQTWNVLDVTQETT